MLSKAEMVARLGFESLYEGKANIIVRESVKNPITKVTELVERTIQENVPCRLSFSTAKLEDEGLVVSSQSVFTLFVSPDVDIPISSKILVVQNGKSYTLSNSKVKSYKTHNEYICTEFIRWA